MQIMQEKIRFYTEYLKYILFQNLKIQILKSRAKYKYSCISHNIPYNLNFSRGKIFTDFEVF